MKSFLLGLVYVFILPDHLSADYSADVELAQYSNISCGDRLRSASVKQIDLQASLNDKTEAVFIVNEQAPDYGLESPVPVLIEQVHWDGRASREDLLQNAIRESAFRGCDLLIILDMDVLEKVMIRPPYMDLKLPVSYVLVLFGSQVKNSAPGNEY